MVQKQNINDRQQAILQVQVDFQPAITMVETLENPVEKPWTSMRDRLEGAVIKAKNKQTVLTVMRN